MNPTEKSIDMYNQIFDHYVKLVDKIRPELKNLGIDIDTKKQERKYLQPTKRRAGERWRKDGEYRIAYKSETAEAINRLPEKEDRIEITSGSFTCRFPLRSLLDLKTVMEKEIPEIKVRYFVDERVTETTK